jgi:PB1 domain
MQSETSEMSAHVKLIQRDGFTRRITFPSKPTWHALAAKIESLYAIPLEKVSVAYIDTENDEVTLSTQEELDDFYQSSYQPGQVIKFIVHDLTSTRVHSTALPQTPGVNIRDTFGGEGFDIEDDWQRLPPFSGLGTMFAPRASGADSPHAFVELVESDAGTIPTNRNEANIMDNGSDTTVQSSDRFPVSSSKGKERAVADDVSSTRSVLAEHTPTKPPVHVFDHNSRDKDDVSVLFGLAPAPASQTVHSPSMPIPTQSTPKVTAQALADPETNSIDDAQTSPDSPKEVDDPPLPSLESTTTPNTSPSLCNDVASLLTAFMTVVNTHPELAEGIRNIIRNTAGGTYWNAHREAISQAAEELAQTTEDIRRRAEEEGGRRVAEALGAMFQTLSQTLGTINPDSSQTSSGPPAEGGAAVPPAEQPEQPATTNSTSFWYGASQANPQPFPNPRGGSAHQPPHTPFFNPWMRGRPPFGPQRGGWGSWIPPPPPVPPPGGLPGHPHEFMHGHRPTPPPPPPPRPFPGSWEPEVSVPLGTVPVNDSFRAKPTPEESKAKVDAARLRYKAEKERYRQEREDRKKERERKAHTIGGEM